MSSECPMSLRDVFGDDVLKGCQDVLREMSLMNNPQNVLRDIFKEGLFKGCP